MEEALAHLLLHCVALARPGDPLAVARARGRAAVLDEEVRLAGDCARVVVVVDGEALRRSVGRLAREERELLRDLLLGACEGGGAGRAVCLAFRVSALTAVLEGLRVPYATLLAECGEGPPAERLDAHALLGS